jgi:hypothetical protein
VGHRRLAHLTKDPAAFLAMDSLSHAHRIELIALHFDWVDQLSGHVLTATVRTRMRI